MKKRDSSAHTLHDCCAVGSWTQVPAIVLSALLLDNGRVFRVGLIASLEYWLIALLCAVSGKDVAVPVGAFLRWGYIPLLLSLLILDHVFHLTKSHPL